MEKPRLLGHSQARRRPAAQEQGVDMLRLTEPPHFPLQRVEIGRNAVILPDRHGKIAVSAVMRAEGNVQVSRPRPEPCRLSAPGTWNACHWRYFYFLPSRRFA